MSKIVAFLSKSKQEKAAEALRVLEDAYAYYTPAEAGFPQGDAPGDSLVAEQSALGQMYAYYCAA